LLPFWNTEKKGRIFEKEEKGDGGKRRKQGTESTPSRRK
jgi:hypothetical protein